MREIFALTSDSPSWTYIREIKDELTLFNNDVMCKKYKDIPIVMGFCFRCLTDDSGWVSKARFYSSEKLLCMDIVNYYSQLMPLKKIRMRKSCCWERLFIHSLRK